MKRNIVKIVPIALLGLTLFSPCLARKEAVNDFTEKRVSAKQRLIYDIHDFLIGESFSLTDVSPEVEQFVRNIQKEMKMEHVTIRLRSFSREIMSLFGRENAAALSIPFANTILISEEWFNSLPEKEKRALIGHELAHIQKKHIYKKAGVSIISYLIFNNIILRPLEVNPIFKSILAHVLAVIPTQMCSREFELEADNISAVELNNNVDGCIDLFKRFKNLRDPHSRFTIKRAIRRIKKFLSYPFRKLVASHPPFSTRIKELEKLTKQNA